MCHPEARPPDLQRLLIEWLSRLIVAHRLIQFRKAVQARRTARVFPAHCPTAAPTGLLQGSFPRPSSPRKSQTVDDTLAGLGLAGMPRLTAFNKVDLLVDRDGGSIANIEELGEYELSLAAHRPDAVLISAERGWALDELLARISESLRRDSATAWRFA